LRAAKVKTALQSLVAKVKGEAKSGTEYDAGRERGRVGE